MNFKSKSKIRLQSKGTCNCTVCFRHGCRKNLVCFLQMEGKDRKRNVSKRAIEKGQEWVKINFEHKRGFVTRPPGEQLSKVPAFSTLSDQELIEKVFEDRIITDAEHEAVRYQWNGVV